MAGLPTSSSSIYQAPRADSANGSRPSSASSTRSSVHRQAAVRTRAGYGKLLLGSLTSLQIGP